ncbi:MAG: hypothetical protein GX471_10250 [Candidatus Microthrix parvicella]|jgi:hypothetical protein|uniref:GH18 domain-containing protein n=1 Tax=Candidatus Neomicrothrix parvicella RN1 TaxID=1229780 RepID=R4YYV8_9ACTN|nr:hypothetical protein [Candidatus Microthrix sp.]NLH66540.1 hypothetical protein [Candidatus Microthrix parvicella]CCM62171.1 exported hypothetical protein [Candidatus Microthrix parvicella RN1]
MVRHVPRSARAAAVAVLIVAGCGGTDARSADTGSAETTSVVDAISTTSVTSTTSKEPPAVAGPSATTTSVPPPTDPPGEAVSLAAFEGSGVWIDVFEWSPTATDGKPRVTPDQVDDMSAAGMTTLYIQSAQTSRDEPVSDPDRFTEFVERAHANNMSVVSWYLPNHTDPLKDLRRVLAPLDFDVDGIGIDLESKNLADRTLRNQRAIELVRNASDLAEDIPIGAVVFAPQALDRYEPNTWPNFPWAEVAAEADVMVPMAYWTIYRDEFPDSADPVAYTNETLMLLRDRVGPDVPIHSAGGLLQDSGTDEVTAAVEAAEQAGVIGVSMYSWSGVKPGQLVSMQEATP